MSGSLCNMQENGSRQVPLTWAGRVRTGNKQTFDYAKDYEVTCRFNEPLTMERIYKELEKAKWRLSRVVGMVVRPGNLVDFTLKSKNSALTFAQALNNLDSIRSASAYADRVVDVRINFIPPGFPTGTNFDLPRAKSWRNNWDPNSNIGQI